MSDLQKIFSETENLGYKRYFAINHQKMNNHLKTMYKAENIAIDIKESNERMLRRYVETAYVCLTAMNNYSPVKKGSMYQSIRDLKELDAVVESYLKSVGF